MPWRAHRGLAAGLALLLLTVCGPVLAAGDPAAAKRAARMAQVKTWTYQLQRLGDPSLTAEASDLLVIDYSVDGSEPRELWPSQIERFKDRAGGGRRIVLAYLSIGEAEDYRFYWQAAWDAKRPDWLMPETCKWPGNHVVQYWRREWRDLIIADPFSYLARIQHAGFDGVYLDRIDAYQQLSPKFPKARAAMVTFVRELALAARKRDPGFLVVAQNAEEMLTDRAYRAVIDGIAKEDLVYGVAGEGKRNTVGDIRASVELLRKLTADGKPVLTVEYLTAPHSNKNGLIEEARREHRRYGFVPNFTARQLDGGAGSAPAPAQAPVLPGTAKADCTN